MNESAPTSLIGGRRSDGEEVVADINPAAPQEHVATEQGKVALDFLTQWKTVYLDA